MLAPLSGNVNLTEKRSEGYYCTDPGVSVYTAAVRKKIIYTDSQGNCLITEKSIAKALKCYVLLARAEWKISRKFRQAAAEYRDNYKELTMPDFWEKYIGDR